MTDTHASESPHGPNVTAYLGVFAALSIFTVMSFIFNGMVRSEPPALTREAGFALILGVAVIKAFLVALIFMHLKWDWGRLYFMIIPVMVLGVLLIVVLLPDIVLIWPKS